MYNAYSLWFYEDGLKCDGFYEVESLDDLFKMIRQFYSTRKTTVIVRQHKIDRPCEICDFDSIVDEFRLRFEVKPNL